MLVEQIVEPALFKSAHAALTFAFNASRSTQGLSVIGKLMGGPPPTGRGLGGFDGLAQAGMIKREVLALQPCIRQHIIIARFATRELPCDCRRLCCSGRIGNMEWLSAISEIADIVRIEALAGTTVNYMLRHIIVRRYFGWNMSLISAANAASVDRDTASLHAARVIGYLKEHERLAWFDIEGRLKAAGMVE